MKCGECGHEITEHAAMRDIIGRTIVVCNGTFRVKKCSRIDRPHNHRPCKCWDELWDTIGLRKESILA